MTTSGQDARQAPQSLTPAGSKGPAGRSPAASMDGRVVMALIGLRMARNVLRSRRFHQALIVGGVGLVALARIGGENRASTLQHLAAWDARQAQRFKQQMERRAGRLERKAERQVRRLERKIKTPPA